MTDSVIDYRAQRGAELLDQRYPGWATNIELENFDFRNPDACALGQTLIWYEDAATWDWERKRKHMWPDEDKVIVLSEAHGFEWVENTDGAGVEPEVVDAYEKAWKKEILRRLDYRLERQRLEDKLLTGDETDVIMALVREQANRLNKVQAADPNHGQVLNDTFNAQRRLLESIVKKLEGSATS